MIIGGPFNSGILASDLSANSKYNYEDAPPELLKKARKIKEACDDIRHPCVRPRFSSSWRTRS